MLEIHHLQLGFGHRSAGNTAGTVVLQALYYF